MRPFLSNAVAGSGWRSATDRGGVRLEVGGRVIEREGGVPGGQALGAGHEQRLGQRVEAPKPPGSDGLLSLLGNAGPAGDQDGHRQSYDVAHPVQERAQHLHVVGLGHEVGLLAELADGGLCEGLARFDGSAA